MEDHGDDSEHRDTMKHSDLTTCKHRKVHITKVIVAVYTPGFRDYTRIMDHTYLS